MPFEVGDREFEHHRPIHEWITALLPEGVPTHLALAGQELSNSVKHGGLAGRVRTEEDDEPVRVDLDVLDRPKLLDDQASQPHRLIVADEATPTSRPWPMMLTGKRSL